MPESNLVRMKRIHYAWIICVVCLLLHFCTGGMTTIGFSLHGPYLRDQLGLSNTQVSMIPTVVSLASMATLPVAMQFYKKFSLRVGTTLSCLLLVVSYVGFSVSSSPWLFYFLGVLLGTARSIGTMVPITFLFRNWFGYRRSTATAIALCGSGICSMIMPPIVTTLVERLGLSGTFLTESALMALIAVLLYAFLRDTPEEMGLQPYASAKEQSNTPGREPIGTTLLTHTEILLLLFAILLVGGVAFPVGSHISIHYTTSGYPAGISALAVSVYGGVLTCSKFLFGFFADRFGAYRINYWFLGSWVVANFLTGMLDGTSLFPLFLSAILEGFGASVATVGMAVWVSNLSTAQTYAHNVGTSQMAFSLGTFATTALPGLIADATGSYSFAFMLFGCMLVGAFVIVQSIYWRNKIT